MSNFRVGQKVVCIDADWHGHGGLQDEDGIPCPLELMRVYTVKAINRRFGVWRRIAGHYTVLQLCEVAHPNPDLGFNVGRFRPAVTRRTDISIFTAMLNPQKLRADA